MSLKLIERIFTKYYSATNERWNGENSQNFIITLLDARKFYDSKYF